MLRDVSFHVVGLSHHTASIELRERFAFTPAEVAAWLQGQAAAGSTALLLSTCNRCEIYWTGDLDLESWFRDFSLSRGASIGEALLRLDGEEAVRHSSRSPPGSIPRSWARRRFSARCAGPTTRRARRAPRIA